MSDERAKIVQKLQKLKALAQSSNEHEAATAKMRLAELMAKHGVTETELAGAEEVELGEWEIKGIDFLADWRLGILTAICMRYGCKALRVFDSERAIGTVVGPKASYEVIEQVFLHFHGLIRDAAKGALQNQGLFIPNDSQTFVQSFCAGATIVLQDRILNESMDVDLDAPQLTAATQANALSLSKVGPQKSMALAQEYVSRMPGIEQARGRSYSQDRHAFYLGKHAAEKMPMPSLKPKQKGQPS